MRDGVFCIGLGTYYRKKVEDGRFSYIRQIGSLNFIWLDAVEGEPEWQLSEQDPYQGDYEHFFEGADNDFYNRVKAERNR
jgi:hypothetical protein